MSQLPKLSFSDVIKMEVYTNRLLRTNFHIHWEFQCSLHKHSANHFIIFFTQIKKIKSKKILPGSDDVINGSHGTSMQYFSLCKPI